MHDTTKAHSTLHLWGRAALWQHAAAPRLAQCPRTLRADRSVVGHQVTPFSALPSRTLCPPASACTMRSNSRGSAPSLPPSPPRPPSPVLPPVCSPSLALPRPWSLVAGSPASFLSVPLPLFSRLLFLISAPRPARARCGAIREATLPPCSPPLLPLPGPALPLVCSFSLVLPCSPSRALGPRPSVSLSPSSLYPPGMHIAEQYARHPSHSLFTLPPPGALVPGLVARTSHCTRVRPLSLYARPASPSLPCPFPSPPHAGHYAGHCVGKSHACRRHAPGPRCMTLRRTPHLWGWTALWQRAAAPRLVLCPRALRAARSVVGHLFASAPRSLFHASVARPLPCPAISVPLPSGQREHDAEQFARRSLFAPSLCPGPLALSCPLSARPPSSSLAPLPRPLGPRPSVSLSPSSLYPPGIHFAEQYARHPSHSLFTLPPSSAPVPGLVARTSHCTRLRPLSLYARPASPSLPCPFPSLHYAGHYTGHSVGKSHACRRHAPGPYRRHRRAGWHHAVAARRCHSPRRSRRRGQPLQMPRGCGPRRPRLPPGQAFTVPLAAPGSRGGSIT